MGSNVLLLLLFSLLLFLSLLWFTFTHHTILLIFTWLSISGTLSVIFHLETLRKSRWVGCGGWGGERGGRGGGLVQVSCFFQNLFTIFFLFNETKIHYKHTYCQIVKIKMIKNLQTYLQLIPDSKILKNVTNIVRLAVKVEKSSYNRLHSRSKWIEIKHMLFWDFGC